MPGVKGQKAWNKREEYEWRDLWKISKSDLLSLGAYFQKQIKKYNNFETAYETDQNFRKLYHKWLEISSTIFVKGIPQKIEAEGFEEHRHFTIIFPPGVEIHGNGRETILSKEISS